MKAKKTQKAANKKTSNVGIAGLKKKANKINSGLIETRKMIAENEETLQSLIQKKLLLEDSYNKSIKKRVEEEEELLEKIKSTYTREESQLKEQLSSLARLAKIYNEKKLRIDTEKQHQSTLEKQLKTLNKKLGELEKL